MVEYKQIETIFLLDMHATFQSLMMLCLESHPEPSTHDYSTHHLFQNYCSPLQSVTIANIM